MEGSAGVVVNVNGGTEGAEVRVVLKVKKKCTKCLDA
jgi:hypothetical protein